MSIQQSHTKTYRQNTITLNTNLLHIIVITIIFGLGRI